MATVTPLPTSSLVSASRLLPEGIYAELSLLSRRTRTLLLDGLPPFDLDCPLAGTVREVERALQALDVAKELTPPPEPAASLVPTVIRVAGLTICTKTRSASTRDGRIALTRYEFDFLSVLALDPIAVITKGQLLRDVWGYRAPVRTRTVDTHASRLRRKITGACAGVWVVNHWGIGYSLTHPAQGQVAS